MSMRNRYIWKTTLKKMREKKSWEFSTSLAHSREKKIINQSNLSKTLTNIPKNGSQQRENSFRLPSRVNEDSIRNLIWKHHQQQQHQKISTNNNKISSNSHQVFQNIHRKRSVLKSLFNKVSGLQPAALSKKRLQHRHFPVNLLWARFFIEHLRTTTSGRPQDFTKNGSNSNS